jgi:cholesterol transport system auxiliary component
MKIRYLIGTGILLLALGGCAMKEAPPLKSYTLDAGKIPAIATQKYRNKVLKVSYPQTLKEPVTDRIAFSYSSSDRGYYQNSQWSNDLGKLLQGSIIETLQRSRIFKAVLPYASTAGEDLRLESTIYDFSHHIRGDASYAVVSVGFSLIDTQTGKLIRTKRFSYREPTPTVNAQGYVMATNRALHRLSLDLIRWLQ